MRKSNTSKKTFIFVFIIAALLFVIIYQNQTSSSHAQAAFDESKISYLSVPIVAEDTLSEIAKEYYTDEFGSLENYMNEIKEYNSMTTDTIYAGNHLIIPVYNRTEDI